MTGRHARLADLVRTDVLRAVPAVTGPSTRAQFEGLAHLARIAVEQASGGEKERLPGRP